MPTINKRALVPFSTQKMFDLVNDIEQYPEFLPWCSKSEVHQRSPEAVEATLHVSKGSFTQAFTTNNTLLPHNRIELRLKDGPFRELLGIWEFVETSATKCEINFKLTFEFSNALLSMVAGPIFSQIGSTLVDSFIQRAHALHVEHTV